MVPASQPASGSEPLFGDQASILHAKLARASKQRIMRGMHVSAPLADKVMADIAAWQQSGHTPALFGFQGDIYQGLQASTFTDEDIQYANERLRILSGLYGILRPLDMICPYRLEIGYGFPVNLYKFWGDDLAKTVTASTVYNLASAEYAKAVVPYLAVGTKVIEPLFLVQYPGEQPKFAAYHAKIARGAYAAWLVKQKATYATKPEAFAEMGYAYSAEYSKPNAPAFILQTTKKRP